MNKKELFPSLIDSWRHEWKNKNLPFYYVQLAPVGSNENPRQDSIHAEFREVQRKALAKSNLGMAITSDIGHPRLIHAPKKKPVGDSKAMVHKQPSSRLEGGLPIEVPWHDTITARALKKKEDFELRVKQDLEITLKKREKDEINRKMLESGAWARMEADREPGCRQRQC